MIISYKNKLNVINDNNVVEKYLEHCNPANGCSMINSLLFILNVLLV